MNLKETQAYISSMPRFITSPVLDVMRAVLCELGNPQEKLKFIHVAGTNGKGSACAYISSVCEESGMKTGLFTSPYVIDFRERFQINGEMISESELCEITEEIKSVLDRMPDCKPPEFGLVTLIGLLWFYKKKCDVVVFEVGLGGRTDPTNVIPTPLCSVIMQIGLDHTDRLGDNLGKIAFEKGGIIKPNGNTVMYPRQEEQVVNVIRSLSIQSESKFVYPRLNGLTNVEYTFKGAKFKWNGEEFELEIAGECQPYNALTAIEAVRVAFPKIPLEDIQNGIRKARIPARIQVIRETPKLIIDGGHNADSVKVLSDYIIRNRVHPICVMGMMKDKDTAGFLHTIGPLCREIYAVQSASPRAETPENICLLAKNYCSKVECCDDLPKLLKTLVSRDEDLLICGSLFVANEAYHALKDEFDI